MPGLHKDMLDILDALLNNLADAMISGFEVDELSITLLSEDRQELRVTVVRGGSRDQLIGYQMPITKGIAGWVARKRRPSPFMEKSTVWSLFPSAVVRIFAVRS